MRSASAAGSGSALRYPFLEGGGGVLGGSASGSALQCLLRFEWGGLVGGLGWYGAGSYGWFAAIASALR